MTGNVNSPPSHFFSRLPYFQVGPQRTSSASGDRYAIVCGVTSHPISPVVALGKSTTMEISTRAETARICWKIQGLGLGPVRTECSEAGPADDGEKAFDRTSKR